MMKQSTKMLMTVRFIPFVEFFGTGRLY